MKRRQQTEPLFYKWEAVWLPLAALLCLTSAWGLWQRVQTPQPPLPQTRLTVTPSPYVAVSLTPRGDTRFPDMSLPQVKREAVVFTPYSPPKTVQNKKPKPNTWAFLGHIGRELILDEVDSFARRATLIVETSDHIQQYIDE